MPFLLFTAPSFLFLTFFLGALLTQDFRLGGGHRLTCGVLGGFSGLPCRRIGPFLQAPPRLSQQFRARATCDGDTKGPGPQPGGSNRRRGSGDRLESCLSGLKVTTEDCRHAPGLVGNAVSLSIKRRPIGV